MPKTPDYFHGRTIVITGAASGIGCATALIFAREGANVVCADIDADGARRAAEAVAQHGAKGLGVPTDVTEREQVNELIRRAIGEYGRVDFLFNSAGAAGRRCKFLEIDDDLLEKTFDLNVKGTFYAMQAVLPHMLENGAGVIVNVASMSHKRGGPGTSVHYASAKGAVLTMTLGVARACRSRPAR
jgi:NAD(P)-dependent dehydrogenase (short-subunit alcohol dehydrogenase family)